MIHPKKFFVAACFGVAAFLSSVTAQFDTNGPGAALTMQGQTASVVDPIGHDVDVPVPGTFTITIDSGANTGSGIIMLASLAPLVGSQFTTPWGGSIDIGSFAQGTGSVFLIADGIGLTVNPIFDSFYRTSAPLGAPLPNRFNQTLTATSFLCGARSAWQAIVADPTIAPIPLDNTEAADANFLYGQSTTLLTGDDGVASIAFAPGHAFPFHGVVYTDVFVCGNGFVSFGAATTAAAQGFSIDTVSWVNAEPSIAVALADWEIDRFGPQDGVFYSETGGATGPRILISWGDPRGLPSGRAGIAHAGQGDVNRFELTLIGSASGIASSCVASPANAGAFEISWPVLAAPAVAQDANGAFGHTPGGIALAASGSITLSRDFLGTSASTGAGVPAIEEHDATGTNASLIGFDGLGGARGFNSFQAAGGLSVAFSPNFGGIPGAFGYTSTPSSTPEDVLLGIVPGSPAIGGGAPTTITLVGKFFGFGNGTVTATGSSGFNIPATSAAVLGGTGPYYTAERLVVTFPPIGTGPNSTVTVNFSSGVSRSIVLPANNVCQTSTPLAIPTNGWVQITPTAIGVFSHYSQNYASCFVHENGLIMFSNTLAPPNSTLAGFFSGFGAIQSAGGIAVLYCDLGIPGTFSNISVVEDVCSSSLTVIWDNQVYFNSGSPAGRFSVEMLTGGPGIGYYNFDYTGLINDTGPFDSAVIGISDGVASPPGSGTDINLATLGGIATAFPGFVSTAFQVSMADDVSTAVVATQLQSIVGSLGPGRFTILEYYGFLSVF